MGGAEYQGCVWAQEMSRHCVGSCRALEFEELGWSQRVGWALPAAALLCLPVPWSLGRVTFVQRENCCCNPGVPLCATGQPEDPRIGDVPH